MIAPLLSFFGRFRQSKTDSITATVSVFGRFRQPKIDDMKVLIGDWGGEFACEPQPGNRFVSCGRAGGAVLSERVFVAASPPAPRAASRRKESVLAAVLRFPLPT